MRHWFSLIAIACTAACDGGGGGGAGAGEFRLIQFLDSNRADIARNHGVTFLFSEPVAPGQDLSQRLKIQSIETGPPSDFTLAIGSYLITGDRVTFVPRLPNLADRSDTGFGETTSYVVFLKGGPDALQSASGNRVAVPQEFTFVTTEFFDDLVPAEPPRGVGLEARDPMTGATTDLSRLDPRAAEVALMDSAELIAAGRFVDPGAGGAPAYGVPWEFVLRVSEPVDPLSVSTLTIQMFEIASNATTTAPDAAPGAPPGHRGTPVQFPVPLVVRTEQGYDAQGAPEVRIVAAPVYTLVDDTRYRIRFSGSIVGLDFRKQFIGENGLTGDGQTVLAGSTPYPEPGGLGYTAEFLVRDRSASTRKRTLTYDPLVDGILPESGQTALDENRFNSALYDPATNPGTAVGFLSAFGDGDDGNLAVSNGTVTLDTGDTANPPATSFQVFDLNPADDYLGNPLPGGPRSYTSPEPFTMDLASLTVSSGATLRITGVNPAVLRVRGIVQVAGTLDVSGGDGVAGGGSAGASGAAGPGGFLGGNTKRPGTCVGYCPGGANDFGAYLNACAAAKANAPHSLNGHGPGRGYAGGASYTYDYQNDLTLGGGSGGGGASHATQGAAGEDRKNVGGPPGSTGLPADTTCGVRNAGVIGVRGQPGPVYGDRDATEILLGGSGGGGGGSVANWNTPKTQAGGSGGGGGGSISIVASGAILLGGGMIDASGGNGGKGAIVVQSAPNNWQSTSGGGGGGAGGLISLISGDAINLTGGLLDARGGTGGARSDVGTAFSCTMCNAGGAGGRGFIFLMDSDGRIDGVVPGIPGEYDAFATGVLTIRDFDANRFGSVAAITELFPTFAANPAYVAFAPSDILAHVNPNQRIRVYASTARADPTNPLVPDIATEIAPVEAALVRHASGATTVDILGDLAALNPSGAPARDSFVRIEARFEYDNGVEGVIGPFAFMDRVDLTISVNG